MLVLLRRLLTYVNSLIGCGRRRPLECQAGTAGDCDAAAAAAVAENSSVLASSESSATGLRSRLPAARGKCAEARVPTAAETGSRSSDHADKSPTAVTAEEVVSGGKLVCDMPGEVVSDTAVESDRLVAEQAGDSKTRGGVHQAGASSACDSEMAAASCREDSADITDECRHQIKCDDTSKRCFFSWECVDRKRHSMIKPGEMEFVEDCLQLLGSHIEQCEGLAQACHPHAASEEAARLLLQEILQGNARCRGTEVAVHRGLLEAVGMSKLVKIHLSYPVDSIDFDATLAWSWDMILEAAG